MATTATLTVAQFRDALVGEKPVLRINASQDKIRYEHYVPLHPEAIDAIHLYYADGAMKRYSHITPSFSGLNVRKFLLLEY